jgi:two-component system sensor histidine kinase HydH
VEQGEKVKILIIVMLVGVITVSHYVSELRQHQHHIFYQGLYFLPIMLSGFWFGLRGGLLTSVSITILYLPFTFIYWKGFTAGDFNNIMEMVLYNAVGVIIGVLRDRDRAGEKRLRQAESLAAMGKAVSGLAHDLKTPLIAIGGLTRFVHENLEEDSPYREKLDIVVKESRRLENMVGEMLDFSRPLELHRSKDDMTQLLSQSLEIVSGMASEKNVTIQTQSLDDLPLISFDSLRMKQVLINLLTNAIEASPEGETVKLSSYRTGEKLMIDVSDHGSGIPNKKKEEIFSPFFTTKKGGAGLGLTIAKKIVEAHQGKLEIFKNTEAGVTFRVVIPIA